MEKGKHERRKVQIFEKYSVLILMATLLMSIGYAEITGIDMQVATNVETTAQEGVFITDITRTEYSGADISLSKINSYIDTTVNSTVVLGSDPGSYITYNVSVYNKTEREQVFIGPFGMTGEGLYDNDLITYELGNLVPYETILEPGKNSYFTITFKYAGTDTDNNTLTSKINFRFMEVPELAITNEGEITGIYPGYTPQEYEFKVSNYNGETINNVALSYGLTAEISKPFIAKIYDSTGAEITSTTAIDVAGKSTETGTATKVDHTYKLKIMWDNTNAENGVEYNSANYAGKTYTTKINLVATPKPNADGDKKYANYTLNKEKEVTVKTAPLYLTVEPNNTTIEMTNNRAEINLSVSNNNGSAYNPYATKYTISQDNNKYTLYVDEVSYANNSTGEITIGTGEKITLGEKIWLVPKQGSTLNKEETANITINITSPYTQTKNIQIKITDTTPPTAPTITGGNTSDTYALEKTISVSEVATDVGTGVQNYQYLLNNTGEALASTTETGDVGSTATETSKTFDTDYNGYYIWFRAVDAVGNVGEWSNSQQLYIDTTGPSAPTITGGNSSYDTTSLTINVETEATDSLSGVAYYEYYRTTNSTEPTATTNATGAIGTTATEKSKTFSENIEGEYIYFRAVDKVGNKGTWSTAQRMYIDINKPTVTLKTAGSVTIEEETDTELNTYFTTDKNGNAEISSTVFTDTSNSNAVVTNTKSLAAGTHVIRCTVTKENGLSNYADKTIVVEKAATVATDGSWNDDAGVNNPYLMSGMTAVYWSTDGGVTASTTTANATPIYSKVGGKSTGADNSAFNWDNWYNYVAGDNATDTKTSRWANAVTDDGSYWVWIPRYKYLISDQPTSTGTTSKGKITVKFIPTSDKKGASGYTMSANSESEMLTKDSNGYIIHPAFENGSSTGKNNGFANGEWDKDLPGFWIAKYEMSMENASGANVNTSSSSIGNVKISSSAKMVSKPGVQSWRYIQVGQIYQNCLLYDSAKGSHMIKNSEWGATAYLTHSQYGRNGNEIYINDSSGYYTGNAGASPTDSSTQSGIGNAYNTTAGMLASTTGNIYGVYDMSGGAWEYVAGWDTKSTSSYIGSYGKAVDGTVYFTSGGSSTKYATAYSNGTDTYYGEIVKTVCRTGDGIKETWISSYYSWFNDHSYFVYSSSPFSIRSGGCDDGASAGVFYSNSNGGGAIIFISFRAVLAGRRGVALCVPLALGPFNRHK